MRWVVLGVAAMAVACSGDDSSGAAGGGSGGGGTGGSGGVIGSAGFPGTGGAVAGSGGASTGGSAGAGGAKPGPCEPISGASYATSPTVGPKTDRPPPQHADLNMALRGWSPTGSALGLVDISGPTDALAPKLNTLFTDDRVPTFVQNYRVNEWDWSKNAAAGPITAWDVTLSGFAATAGEVLELPNSGYEIGAGLQARVLYVSDTSITLKYTGEDNVVSGYTIHAEGVCVEPSLRALYETKDSAGRSDLPALSGNQAFGRARGSEVLVAIRDTGAFMDPRAKKDWW